MIRVGITGHQRLAEKSAWLWVRAAVSDVLADLERPLIGISNLAVGSDQLFSEVVLEQAGSLEVVLPFADYRTRVPDEDNRGRYDRLLAQASNVEVLAHDGRSDEEAYLRAGRRVVARCDLLVSIWDGRQVGRLGGTEDIVRYARAQRRAMVRLDPATRTVTRLPAQPAPASTLTDDQLDALRAVGDSLVDRLVAAYFDANGGDAFAQLMRALFQKPGLPEENPLVATYLRQVDELDLGDAAHIERGQRLFALFGPEIFLVLGSCSLPLAFAAGNGVQAIYRARRLKDDPVRRLYETAQMIINVMQAGELGPRGAGWLAARKVRLIHALIRRHVQCDAQPWSGSWGTPINQEDLAGTLLSFSVAVLHGLRRMGAKISAEDGDAYVYAWSAVGRLLGVEESLLCRTESEAAALALRIGNRQIRATPEGKALAEQLLGAVATLFPIKGYANSLTHFFLADTSFGADVARVLELPKPSWTRSLVAARAWQKRRVLSLLALVPGAQQRRSYLARRFVQAMILLKRPDHNVPFDVPPSLARLWGLRSSRRWARRRRLGRDLGAGS